MKTNKGISLIVLIITIIVIIILAGSVVLSLVDNNPIEQASEAKYKLNVKQYNAEFVLSVVEKYSQGVLLDTDTLDAGVWDGTEDNKTGTIKQYIPSITVEDGLVFEIQDSKIVYVGEDDVKIAYNNDIGVINGTISPPPFGIGIIADDNRTINGAAATYQNPIIPKGFKAINDPAVWPTGWNDGLVIQDESGNQFVWVPVDGTAVPYAKWCTTGVSHLATTDEAVPAGFSVTKVTTTYGGFYIGRYESMFDYNLGSPRAASKKSTNKIQGASWAAARDLAHDGYLWNYINYTDAKSFSYSMAASYGYDPNKVGTKLLNGTDWDTTVKWIKNAGINVSNSTAWGNHSDSPLAGHGFVQISGFSETWKAKNIYDLAGNVWEWTSEISTTFRLGRGGSFFVSGISESFYPVVSRTECDITGVGSNLSFRVGLYVI